jgi:hypothetical protein
VSGTGDGVEEDYFYPNRVLERLFTIMKAQQKGTLGKIRGFFRQPEAATRLEICKQELKSAVEIFKVNETKSIEHIFKVLQMRATGSTLTRMGQMKQDAKEQHEELLALLEVESDHATSDHFSVSSKYVCCHH